MAGYDKLPAKAIGHFEKFKVHISEEKLSQFKDLIRLSPVGPLTYENKLEDREFGVSRSWLVDAKKTWETTFDWRAQEDFINSTPQFKTVITDDDGTMHDVHFMAIFSQKQDAVPISFFHGWPGSFLEFIGLFKVFTQKYTPETLPYHLIAPSLTGYTLSSGPPTDKDWTRDDTARIMHKLLISIGFADGYVTQGGDVGASIARILGVKYSECKAVHLNFDSTGKPDGVDDSEVTEAEAEGLERRAAWQAKGIAYSLEHGTRPSTIGLVLSSSPIALLAWIGEKFLEWTDEDPPLEEILLNVSLYWLTDTFPRAIYPYRGFIKRRPGNTTKGFHTDPSWYIRKPFGFSYFPKELLPVPKAWVAKSGNLVFHRMHDKGGHFAAMERPEDFAKDIEDFVQEVWKG